jgi:hypothetical protein
LDSLSLLVACKYKADKSSGAETLSSPRFVGITNAVLLALTITCFLYIGVAFPSGVYNCDGIVAGVLMAALFSGGSHILVTLYLWPALSRKVFPWNERGDDSPYTRAKAAAAPLQVEAHSLAQHAELETKQHAQGYSELRDIVMHGEESSPAAEPTKAAYCTRNHIARVTLFSVCTLSVAVLYAFAGIGIWLQSATLPDLSATRVLNGLNAKVTLYRDDVDVVHVYATTDSDAYFGQGFAHAQLRLWQLEFQRRVGAGRLAEVAGSAALDIDKSIRTLGVYASAQNAYLAVDNVTRAALDSYVAGVNAYITRANAGLETLPLEFSLLGYQPEPWNVADSIVWYV